MKISFLFLVVGLLSVSASTYPQKARVSMDITDQSIFDIFNEIKKQTSYSFWYESKDVDIEKNKSIQVENETVENVLRKILDDQNVDFTLKGNHVLITKKNAANTYKNNSIDQTRNRITGIIKDDQGEPVPGASVSIKGTTKGVVSDIDGNFIIDVNPKEVLVISFIGYITQEIPIENQQRLTIILTENTEVLEDVVVVGYGTQKKASVVGSVQSIRVDELKVPSANLSTGFAGRLAGVVAVQRSGEPGADGADFWIRGISTFSGMTSPLIVIDGVKASSGDLNALDPEIIEGFSILKDATATALYGTRGANGVMIVTTKSGRDLDKPIVNVRFETSYTAPIKVPKFVDGADYMKMYNEAVNTRKTGEILYPQDKIDGTIQGVDPYVFPNVDWYNELFRKGAMSQNLNVSVRGGGRRIDYFSSVSVNHDSGMLKNVKNFSYDNNLNITRYVLQNNINVYITPTTKATVRLNAQLRDYHGSHMSAKDVFELVMEANPVDFPIRFPDDPEYAHIRWGGKTGGFFNNGFRNPYAEMVRGYSDNFQSTVLGVVELNQKLDFFTKGLSANAIFSFKNWSSTETSRSGNYNQYEVSGYEWNADRNGIDRYNLRRVGEEVNTVLNTDNSSTGDRQIYIQAMINYDRTFNHLHNVTGMLLYNQEEYNVNNPSGLIQSLPQRKQGVAGRVTYSYDYKYLLELNFGYNGSENFAKGHRFGFFPSVGMGYVISNENYFKGINHIITNLKVRGSWGLVGNDQIGGSRYLYLSEIELRNGDFGYTTGRDQNITKDGPKYSRFANPNITWEIGEKTNIGLDVGILHHLNISIDAFKEVRKDIFMQRESIPEFVGLNPTDKWTSMKTEIYGNLGKVKNTGFDASIDFAKQFSRDFSASFKATFTYATNKVLESDQPSYAKYPNLSRVGHSVNTNLLYIAERLFIDDAEVANNPVQNIGGFIGAGDIKYTNIPDVHGEYDNMIDANDRQYTGNPTVPEIIYGFGPSFHYKNFDFSFFFQGVARTSILMSSIHPFGTNGTRNVLKYIADDYWSEGRNPNIYAKYPRLSKMDNTNNTVASTYWLRNGAFLKLKNAEVGYNYKTFRFYLRGANLLTFSKFKHWDPEQGGGNGLFYPTQRVVNLGVQLTFNK